MQRHGLVAPQWLWVMDPGRAGLWRCSCGFSCHAERDSPQVTPQRFLPSPKISF